MSLGTFSTTIPAGSFKANDDGSLFKFKGVINSVALEAVIQPIGKRRFGILASVRNANLTGTANPVKVDLTIGDDNGTASVTAKFEKENDEIEKDE